MFAEKPGKHFQNLSAPLWTDIVAMRDVKVGGLTGLLTQRRVVYDHCLVLSPLRVTIRSVFFLWP